MVEGSGAHGRDEVENNAGMMEDDAGVLGCFHISLDKTDSSGFRKATAVICRSAS